MSNRSFYRANMLKRIINLMFAAAVIATVMFPISANAQTADTTHSDYLHSGKKHRNEQKNIDLPASSITNSQVEVPSFEEYIRNLFCTGCGRHCPLTALQCSRGQAYLEQARAEFEATNAQQSTDSSDSTTKADATATTDSKPPLDLFMGYAPLGGLMVGGVYYTFTFLKKKKASDTADAEEGL